MTRKQRRLTLIGLAGAVLALALGLVLYAMNDTIVFFHAPGDVQALAGRLETLAADRALLAQMSKTALKRYTRHPTWEATTASIRDFLLEIARHSEE